LGCCSFLECCYLHRTSWSLPNETNCSLCRH
jgi:hypothetical protein